MNRRQRRALLAVGTDVTKKKEVVEVYDSDSVHANLGTEERDATDPRVAVVGPTDPRPMARPGQTGKLKIYPDPKHVPTEEQPEAPIIRGYRRHAHSVMYIGTAGLREYMPPVAGTPEVQVAHYEATFERMAKQEKLRLVTRQEKRDMWREEQKVLAARKKRQKEEVARILYEADST